MQRRGRSSEARLFGRANTERLAFLSAAAFVALIAGMALMQGPGPRGAASASEPAQLEGPARIIARDLPPAAAEIADQARNMERRPRQPPQAAKAATGADPAANAGDKSVGGQAASAPSVSGSGFEGMDDGDNNTIAGFTLTPPDAQVAVGPNHVFEMVNVIGRIYTRAGGTVQTFTLRSFFGVAAGYADTDPRVFYDAVSGRWFASYVSYLDLAGSINDRGRLHLAISQTDDPTGAWNLYFLSYNQVLPDYEAVGVTTDKLTVSSNIFDVDSNAYFGVETLVFEKADVMAGVPGPSVRLFAFARRTDRFTVRPAQGLSSGNDQYLVTRDGSTATILTVIKVTGTPGAGNVTEAYTSNRTMLAQNAPPASSALGGNINSGDNRLLDAMWRNGRLWTSASAACLPAGDVMTRS